MEEKIKNSFCGKLRLDIIKDGKYIDTIEESNMVTKSGIKAFFGSIFNPDSYNYINNVKIGNSDTQNEREMTDLQGEGRSSVSVDSRNIATTESATTSILNFVIPEDKFNEKWIREFGLFTTEWSLFSRFVISSENQFLKTEDVSIIGQWKIIYMENNKGRDKYVFYRPKGDDGWFITPWFHGWLNSDSKAIGGGSEREYAILRRTTGEDFNGWKSDTYQTTDERTYTQKTKMYFDKERNHWTVIWAEGTDNEIEYVGSEGDVSPVGLYATAIESNEPDLLGYVYLPPLDPETGKLADTFSITDVDAGQYRYVTKIRNRTRSSGIDSERYWELKGNRTILPNGPSDSDINYYNEFLGVYENIPEIWTLVGSEIPLESNFMFNYESNRYGITAVEITEITEKTDTDLDDIIGQNLLDSVPEEINVEIDHGDESPYMPNSMEVSSSLFEYLWGVDFEVTYSFLFVVETSGDDYVTITPGEGTVYVPSEFSQEFTFTPDEGHEIKLVYVDGDNKGSIESYTFDSVVEDHEIKVITKSV